MNPYLSPVLAIEAPESFSFISPPPRLKHLSLAPGDISLERLHKLNGKLIAEIDAKIKAVNQRRTAINTRILIVNSKLQNLEWEKQETGLKIYRYSNKSNLVTSILVTFGSEK